MARLRFLVRNLGLRHGLRAWWRGIRPAASSSQWTHHHGARPSMPGYRRRAR